MVVDEEADIDGLPILSATVTPTAEAAALPLPAGPVGPQGAIGRPRAPFTKMGSIANAGARPTGLTADDRGKWWHRLDDDGMDFWNGTTWVHSIGAVGAQGPAAPATTITTTTLHNASLTTPAARFTGTGPDLQLAVTAPAGLQGDEGPAGASGSIATATDFDSSTGPAQRGIFVWAAGARKWQVKPAPNGFGVYSWWNTDFLADTQSNTERLVAGTFTIPAQPFAYRPMVYGHLGIYCAAGNNTDGEIRVRLGSEMGAIVGAGAGIRADGAYYVTVFGPAIGDSTTKPISPTSTVASVPAYTETSVFVTVERVGQGTSGEVGFQRARASLTLWTQPIG